METVEERTVEPEQDYPSGEDTGHAIVSPDADVDDAVLVRVVETPALPESFVDWQAFPAFIADNAVQVAGANRNRTRMFIRNGNAAAGESVLLMPEGTTPREFGYVLEAQDAVEFFHNGPVWAQCAAGESAPLSVFVEYVAE
jgi:hypothetical protein